METGFGPSPRRRGTPRYRDPAHGDSAPMRAKNPAICRSSSASRRHAEIHATAASPAVRDTHIARADRPRILRRARAGPPGGRTDASYLDDGGIAARRVRSAGMTRNQYIPCPCAQRSLTPALGNAASAEWRSRGQSDLARPKRGTPCRPGKSVQRDSSSARRSELDRRDGRKIRMEMDRARELKSLATSCRVSVARSSR